MIKDAISLFENNPSFDRTTRLQQMKNYDKDKSDVLDDRYYDSEIELLEHISKYIKNNSEKFYFKRIVEKPVFTP